MVLKEGSGGGAVGRGMAEGEVLCLQNGVANERRANAQH